MYLQFLSFLYTDMTQVVETFLMENNDLHILHSQYRGCWWLGNAKSQNISDHGIDCVGQE